MAADDDLSAIGADAGDIKITDLARKEEKQFELERIKEDHEHVRRSKEQELGAVGRLFGSRENAVVYLVGFLVLTSVTLLAALIFTDQSLHQAAMEILKVIIYAGVGFLTGKSLDGKKD